MLLYILVFYLYFSLFLAAQKSQLQILSWWKIWHTGLKELFKQVKHNLIHFDYVDLIDLTYLRQTPHIKNIFWTFCSCGIWWYPWKCRFLLYSFTKGNAELLQFATCHVVSIRHVLFAFCNLGQLQEVLWGWQKIYPSFLISMQSHMQIVSDSTTLIFLIQPQELNT